MNFFISLKAHAINRIALKVKLKARRKRNRLRLYYSSNAHLDKYARTMQKNLIVPFGNTNSEQCAIVLSWTCLYLFQCKSHKLCCDESLCKEHSLGKHQCIFVLFLCRFFPVLCCLSSILVHFQCYAIEYTRGVLSAPFYERFVVIARA